MLVSAFDRIVIAVPDLSAASRDYQCLLGIEPLRRKLAEGESPSTWFALANTVLELVQSEATESRIRGLVFSAPGIAGSGTVIENTRGLDIRLCDGSRSAALRQAQPDIGCSDLLVDHIVLRTAQAQECVELFGRRLGIRLALDQTVPEWGGRMLFFRTGKLTLEVIESERDQVAQDYFWGIAYQCRDLARTVRELAGRGVSLSEIRAGRKAGSQVATVKSHSLGIPTLLLEPARSR